MVREKVGRGFSPVPPANPENILRNVLSCGGRHEKPFLPRPHQKSINYSRFDQ
jgi:hypothetical protein